LLLRQRGFFDIDIEKNKFVKNSEIQNTLSIILLFVRKYLEFIQGFLILNWYYY